MVPLQVKEPTLPSMELEEEEDEEEITIPPMRKRQNGHHGGPSSMPMIEDVLNEAMRTQIELVFKPQHQGY